MAFNLGDVLKDVSNLDTGLRPDGREQIEYIDIGLIDPDPNNFYELSGVEVLAANIELLGLQQPLRVRDNPDISGHVRITSGHRRRAAIALLVDEGKAQFAQVPCIREAAANSAALQELRLIYANSDTRKMSSAELSKQAERVEALLYQLKEEGMDFPGRMRDHVAEACKLSKSKLARLKVIREKLDKPFFQLYERGTIAESVAYALAQQPVEIQKAVHDYKCTGKDGAKYLREWQVDSIAGNYKKITGRTCKFGGTCSYAAALLGKIYDGPYGYKPCEHVKCCSKCDKLASCKSACPKLKDKIQKLKADKKAAAQQEKLAKEEKERPDIEQITTLWARFGEARRQAHQSVRKCMEAAKMMYGTSDDQKYSALENAHCKITPQTTLPYGYNSYLADARKLIAVADLLGCSLDYLFCRTDKPAPEIPQETADAPRWNSGEPEQNGHYYVSFDCDGLDLEDDLWFDPELGWYEPGRGKFDLGEVNGWIRLPDGGAE